MNVRLHLTLLSARYLALTSLACAVSPAFNVLGASTGRSGRHAVWISGRWARKDHTASLGRSGTESNHCDRRNYSSR
jgi:hypothetical protein